MSLRFPTHLEEAVPRHQIGVVTLPATKSKHNHPNKNSNQHHTTTSTSTHPTTSLLASAYNASQLKMRRVFSPEYVPPAVAMAHGRLSPAIDTLNAPNGQQRHEVVNEAVVGVMDRNNRRSQSTCSTLAGDGNTEEVDVPPCSSSPPVQEIDNQQQLDVVDLLTTNPPNSITPPTDSFNDKKLISVEELIAESRRRIGGDSNDTTSRKKSNSSYFNTDAAAVTKTKMLTAGGSRVVPTTVRLPVIVAATNKGKSNSGGGGDAAIRLPGGAVNSKIRPLDPLIPLSAAKLQNAHRQVSPPPTITTTTSFTSSTNHFQNPQHVDHPSDDEGKSSAKKGPPTQEQHEVVTTLTTALKKNVTSRSNTNPTSTPKTPALDHWSPSVLKSPGRHSPSSKTATILSSPPATPSSSPIRPPNGGSGGGIRQPMALSPIRSATPSSIRFRPGTSNSTTTTSPPIHPSSSAGPRTDVYDPRAVHFGAFDSPSNIQPYVPGQPSHVSKIRVACQISSSTTTPQQHKKAGFKNTTERSGSPPRRSHSPVTSSSSPKKQMGGNVEPAPVVPIPRVMEVVDFSFQNLQTMYSVLFRLPRNAQQEPTEGNNAASTSTPSPYFMTPVAGRFNPLDFVEGGLVYEKRKKTIAELHENTEMAKTKEENRHRGAMLVGLYKNELNTIKAKGETYVFPKDAAGGSHNGAAAASLMGRSAMGGAGGHKAGGTSTIVYENALSFLYKMDAQSLRERDVEDELYLNVFAKKYLEHPVARVIFRKGLHVSMLPHVAGLLASIKSKPITFDQQKQLVQYKILQFPTGVSMQQKIPKNNNPNSDRHDDHVVAGGGGGDITAERVERDRQYQQKAMMNSSSTSMNGGEQHNGGDVDDDGELKPEVIVAPIETTGNTMIDLRRVTGCKILNLSNNSLGAVVSSSSVTIAGRSAKGNTTTSSGKRTGSIGINKKGTNNNSPSKRKSTIGGGGKSNTIPDTSGDLLMKKKPSDDELLNDQCRLEHDFGGFRFASLFLAQRITRLDTVTTLDLSSNSLHVFPVKFIHYDLPSLTSLAFHKNDVQSFSSIVELAAGILRDPVTSATRFAVKKEQQAKSGEDNNTHSSSTSAAAMMMSQDAPNFAILPAVLKSGRLHRYNAYDILTPVADRHQTNSSVTGSSTCRIPSLPTNTAHISEDLANELFDPESTPLVTPPLFLHMLLTTPQKNLFPLTLGEREFPVDNNIAVRKARVKQVIQKVVGVVPEDLRPGTTAAAAAAAQANAAHSAHHHHTNTSFGNTINIFGSVTNIGPATTNTSSPIAGSSSRVGGGPPSSSHVVPMPRTRYIRAEYQSSLQQRLRSLTLHGNPIQTQHFNVYRQKVIFLFPNLVSLDVNPVTAMERSSIMW